MRNSHLSETLYGTNSPDDINGFGGNDAIYGYPSPTEFGDGNDNDTLKGGDGNDTIKGGNGDDLIYGKRQRWNRTY